MAWRIEIDPRAARELERIDAPHRRRIVKFLKERVATLDDPRSIGEALRGPLRKLWKYRVGSYRIIADIQNGILVVLVLRIGHRRQVYLR